MWPLRRRGVRPLDAEDEIPSKFEVSCVDQNTAASDLWKNVGKSRPRTRDHMVSARSPRMNRRFRYAPRHHRTGRDSYHKVGPRAFERHHGIDIPAAVARLNLRPTIRIESGSFVGQYLDEDYVAGSGWKRNTVCDPPDARDQAGGSGLALVGGGISGTGYCAVSASSRANAGWL